MVLSTTLVGIVHAFQTPTKVQVNHHVRLPTTSSTTTTTTTTTTTSLALSENEIPNIHQNHSRRFYLKQTIGTAAAAATATLSSLLTYNPPALAAQTTGEAIRRSAANLPGYGQADVFYPSSFLGKWKVTQTIVSSDDPMIVKSIKNDEISLPLVLSYDVRFITVDGDDSIIVTKEDGGSGASANVEKVIADRQYNENSYYNALRDAIMKKQSNSSNTQSLPPSIQTTSWSPSNPNVLTSNYNDGSNKEIKVTKRATELDEVNGIISSSEYRRITTTGAATTAGSNGGIGGGIPSIAASRSLKKWKISEFNGNGDVVVVEGIEIVYSDGGTIGDPLMAAPGAGGRQPQQPQMSSKSRLRLERYS